MVNLLVTIFHQYFSDTLKDRHDIENFIGVIDPADHGKLKSVELDTDLFMFLYEVHVHNKCLIMCVDKCLVEMYLRMFVCCYYSINTKLKCKTRSF